jgi:hypothetical protein
MEDPFRRRDRMVAIANAAVPVLVDRLGGTVTVSELELAALGDRYGGAVVAVQLPCAPSQREPRQVVRALPAPRFARQLDRAPEAVGPELSRR